MVICLERSAYLHMVQQVTLPQTVSVSVCAYGPADDAATKSPFFVAYQNLPGRCLVCKHGSHVTNIPKADWSSMKNKQITATPC